MSLLLSFTVVLGITFHATGYVIGNPWMRFFKSTVSYGRKLVTA